MQLDWITKLLKLIHILKVICDKNNVQEFGLVGRPCDFRAGEHQTTAPREELLAEGTSNSGQLSWAGLNQTGLNLGEKRNLIT
jgi:hypothetical protein